MEKKINSKVVGGHTIFSEWPLVGGEASGFVSKNDIIPKQGVKEGDKLILTKPIGIQAVMASYRLLKDAPEILENYSKKKLEQAIEIAIDVMTTPNQDVVKTIHSYNDFSFIHAMTDITGFGLAGHAEELLQNSVLSGTIDKIPYIKLAKSLSDDLGYAYDECKCHETAGGLLLSVDKEYSEEFSHVLHSNHIKNWIIGSIDKSKPGHVHVSEEAEHIEINKF
jgi:selenide,water dikinase